jgi:hypothetical protein
MSEKMATELGKERGADTAQSLEGRKDEEQERHIGCLHICIEVTRQARASGNTPFGASTAAVREGYRR